MAHYKTADTTKTAATTASGAADVPFSIAGATSGYSVRVDVNVAGRETCNTQFTPQ